MKILVTGANGFLGQPTVGKLINQGHRVVCLGRHDPKLKAVDFFKADLTKPLELIKAVSAIKSVDALLHLAAFVPKKADSDNPRDNYLNNLVGTINVVEAFAATKKIIFASTAEVYGLPKSERPIKESDNPNPISYYALSKLAAEDFLKAFGEKNNKQIIILRFSVLYGSNDQINRAIPNFISAAKRGENLKVFGGSEKRNYLYIDDAVDAILLSLNSKQTGSYNVGSGKGISVLEAAKKIRRTINPNIKIERLPRQKPISDLVLDISKTKSEMGF